jgi:hypothetical protein
MLHVVATGIVIRPVTLMELVAVKRASIYETDSPLAELTGSASKRLPIKIAIINPNKIICVVDNLNLLLIFIFLPFLIFSPYIAHYITLRKILHYN